ncbi:pantoate--beta-alanine ligase [Listeria grandensis]|uniref:Pantothenate synthetase n=1 Tax=Listeria grandensis TaxID=1494963 RepID=A0A7X0Y2C3_9LIST|nr:pantoate--beta-alanine ligase [Listeria grandensis]MBC1935418.1 pantoate--beta-alanine ligase [Listeria grandensis]
MKIIRSREMLDAEIKGYQKKQQSIGFVPTMGYLHEGHLALVAAAKQENEIVVMSIFVNPAQFGPNEDLESYPRDEVHDRKLAEANGVDLLFIPSVEVMYPESLTAEIHVKQRISVLDGAARPGHFDGVVTVLAKLFHLVQPTNAYFGQKDAQQVAVVEGFVADYFFPVTIRVIPTVREQDGLAKSSRNVYLTAQERKEAAVIHEALVKAREQLSEIQDREAILANIRSFIDKQTTHHGMVYLNMYQYPSFEPVTNWDDPIIIAICLQYSKARLIDNEITTGVQRHDA